MNNIPNFTICENNVFHFSLWSMQEYPSPSVAAAFSSFPGTSCLVECCRIASCISSFSPVFSGTSFLHWKVR